MVGEIFVNIATYKVEPIVDIKIDTPKLIANPVLLPVLEINKFHESQELIISQNLSKYVDSKQSFDKMLEINSTYKTTIFYSVVSTLLDCSSIIINNLMVENSNMKKCINDMIKKVNQDYRLLNYLEEITSETNDKQESIIENTITQSKPQEPKETEPQLEKPLITKVDMY